MRLGWYAGVSTALAGSVVLSAFHQRANFYSAMVYLAQSNFCLLALVNFTLILYSSFIYGLTRLFFGPLRAVEVEQLTERAWFAITETCLAMTIFREEIGAWFLVMFTGLVTGKVWGWIGDGRVEIFEQQPPANPRLFHLRLTVSLSLSFIYDIYILRYTINTVIQQARPNMMVMFLFEFALLATSSWRTGARYALSITEQNIQEAQKRKRLAERRIEVREERETMIRQREAAAAAGEEVSEAPLPSEDDIDEMDIEVPGWSSKGEWVLWLDLLTDMVKLGIYVAFFVMLLMFYGLPIHILRDLFMTTRDFVKRLNALVRYRRAIQEMNRYPDATQEDLSREDTCIICREEMRPWEPENNPGAVDRVRPKKLPCGHILHLGCLKSWLERQQVCPTCRRPVTGDNARAAQNALNARPNGGAVGEQGQPPPPGGAAPVEGQQDGAGQGPRRQGRPRIFNLGPIRLGFGANGQQVRELAQQFGIPQAGLNPGGAPPAPPAAPTTAPPRLHGAPAPAMAGDNLQNIGNLLQQADQMIQREVQTLHATQQELQTIHLLTAELQRLRSRQHQNQDQVQQSSVHPAPYTVIPIPAVPAPQQSHVQMQPQVMSYPAFPGFPTAPPRNQSPIMARHSAPNYANAIPAGSADLPDGVVIPPGWSLLPLQRLDGNSNSTQLSPQAPPQATNGESSTVNRLTPTTVEPFPNGGVNSETQPPLTTRETSLVNETTPSGPLPENSAAPRLSQPAEFSRTVEPPPVVAPSPRMPNWGGSAQLFGNSPRLDQGEGETTIQTEASVQASDSQRSMDGPTLLPQPAVKTTPNQRDDGDGDDSSEAGDSSSSEDEVVDKGKGKAVTVEDVDDEDDEEDDTD